MFQYKNSSPKYCKDEVYIILFFDDFYETSVSTTMIVLKLKKKQRPKATDTGKRFLIYK